MTDGSEPTGVANEDVLLRFADATLASDPLLLDAARDAVTADIGADGMIDAAAVIGGFDGITRIADATGIPLEPAKAEASADFIAELGIGQYRAQKI